MSVAEEQAKVELELAVEEEYCEDNLETNYVVQNVDQAEQYVPPRGLDASELKQKISIVGLLKADGHKFSKSGKYLKCLCPFHGERTPSFTTWNEVYARCYGACGWSGDIFDYVMKRDNCDFMAAKRSLEQFLKTHEGKKRMAPPAKPGTSKQRFSLSDKEKEQVADALSRLPNNLPLCEYIAGARGWKTETIIQLGMDGHLGWARGALAFIYETGMKLRAWPHRMFSWEFGHQSIWRGERISSGKRVFVTEGETDAISLIDAGLEGDGGSVVVAIPGARSFQEVWAEKFEGVDVVLCLDNDPAGQAATEDVAAMLAPYAKSLSVLDFEEVLQ